MQTRRHDHQAKSKFPESISNPIDAPLDDTPLRGFVLISLENSVLCSTPILALILDLWPPSHVAVTYRVC